MNSIYFLILCCVYVFALKKNVKHKDYSISKPHYLSITGPSHSILKDFPKVDNSYEIPDYIYKKVFIQNIPYKINK